MSLFHEVLYRPLFNALILLYEFLPGRDLGLAIIVLTVLVRLLLSPLLTRQFRSQRALTVLQPQMAEIRSKTKDRAEQSRRLLALYKEHGVNPASGCLPLLVQLPVLWAMFAVLRDGIRTEALSALYPFVPNPGAVDSVAFGTVNLAQSALQRTAEATVVVWPAVALAVLTGFVTYWQMRLTPGTQTHTAADDKTPAEQAMHRMSRQMLFIAPITTAYFSFTFPSGLALYWLVSTLVAVAQQRYLLSRKLSTPKA